MILALVSPAVHMQCSLNPFSFISTLLGHRHVSPSRPDISISKRALPNHLHDFLDHSSRSSGIRWSSKNRVQHLAKRWRGQVSAARPRQLACGAGKLGPDTCIYSSQELAHRVGDRGHVGFHVTMDKHERGHISFREQP